VNESSPSPSGERRATAPAPGGAGADAGADATAPPVDGTRAPTFAADVGALVRLRGVTKTFGEGVAAFQALRGVDLDLAPATSSP
jgi:hypothetical protein